MLKLTPAQRRRRERRKAAARAAAARRWALVLRRMQAARQAARRRLLLLIAFLIALFSGPSQTPPPIRFPVRSGPRFKAHYRRSRPSGTVETPTFTRTAPRPFRRGPNPRHRKEH